MKITASPFAVLKKSGFVSVSGCHSSTSDHSLKDTTLADVISGHKGMLCPKSLLVSAATLMLPRQLGGETLFSNQRLAVVDDVPQLY